MKMGPVAVSHSAGITRKLQSSLGRHCFRKTISMSDTRRRKERERGEGWDVCPRQCLENGGSREE